MPPPLPWLLWCGRNPGFYPQGDGKAQIAIQVSRLEDTEDVERERTAWRAALTKLQAQLER